MISLELAQKLKAAGLEWEPRVGDWAQDMTYDQSWLGVVRSVSQNKETISLGRLDFGYEIMSADICIWLPRLDQLLAEIEARGYLWGCNRDKPKGYTVYIWEFGFGYNFVGTADTPEDAAAKALLWILQQTN